MRTRSRPERLSLSAAGLLAALLAAPVRAQDLIFADGFESGDTSAWDPCDPDGTYTVSNGGPISYTCCFGLININISSFILSLQGSQVNSSPSNPATLIGSPATCPEGEVLASATQPGDCTVTYSLSASFVSAQAWTGTYDLTFTGSACGCFGGADTPCVNQTFPIEAAR